MFLKPPRCFNSFSQLPSLFFIQSFFTHFRLGFPGDFRFPVNEKVIREGMVDGFSRLVDGFSEAFPHRKFMLQLETTGDCKQGMFGIQ